MKVLRFSLFSGILALACGVTTLTAQVTIGSLDAPQDFSVLELISNNNKGMRLPQMDSVQRKAMQATAAFQTAKTGAAMGLQIFNTDTKCVETWNGTKWISVCAPHVNDIIPDNKGGNNWENTKWVGAFWRDSQTGERVIASKVGTPAATTWTAEVDNPAGTGSWLTLEASGGSDKTLWTATPDDAENHQLPSTRVTSISGSGHILFRMGATGKNPAANSADFKYPDNTSGKPPRYATVTLKVTISGVTTNYKLYCRQGEAADYVFELNETAGTSYPSPRSAAKKFSPYNLTNKDLTETTLSGVFTGVASNSATYRGAFVEYPTQAGAFFQWGMQVGNNVTYAYHPSLPGGQNDLIAGWINSGYDNYWDNIKAEQETSPAGFRRPKDGTTNSAGFEINVSEFGQSLFLNPQNTGLSNADNSVCGYYADGYFDRRQIENPVYSTNDNPNSVVNRNSKDVAYRGGLFFHPTKNNSLFFPAAGYRTYVGGRIRSIGSVGTYFSATLVNLAGNLVTLSLDVSNTGNTYIDWGRGIAVGQNIRSVVE